MSATAGHIDVWQIEETGALRAEQVLRAVATSLAQEPGELTLGGDHRGRPFVEGRADVGVSVSHCDHVTLVAVAAGRSVGVDIERLESAGEIAAFAPTYLPPQTRRDQGWVEIWTELEACAKLRGEGLGDLDPERAAGLLATPHRSARFRPTPEHLATLVHDGPAARVVFRSVSGLLPG